MALESARAVLRARLLGIPGCIKSLLRFHVVIDQIDHKTFLFFCERTGKRFGYGGAGVLTFQDRVPFLELIVGGEADEVRGGASISYS